MPRVADVNIRVVNGVDIINHGKGIRQRNEDWSAVDWKKVGRIEGHYNPNRPTTVRISNQHNAAWIELFNAQRTGEDKFCDVHLIADEGHVRIHRTFIEDLSPFVKDQIKEACVPCKEDVVSITLAGVKFEHLKVFVTMIYGGMPLIPVDEEQHIKAIIKLLQIQNLKYELKPSDFKGKHRKARGYIASPSHSRHQSSQIATVSMTSSSAASSTVSVARPPSPTGSSMEQQRTIPSSRSPSRAVSSELPPEYRKVAPASVVGTNPDKRIKRKLNEKTSPRSSESQSRLPPVPPTSGGDTGADNATSYVPENFIKMPPNSNLSLFKQPRIQRRLSASSTEGKSSKRTRKGSLSNGDKDETNENIEGTESPVNPRKPAAYEKDDDYVPSPGDEAPDEEEIIDLPTSDDEDDDDTAILKRPKTRRSRGSRDRSSSNERNTGRYRTRPRVSKSLSSENGGKEASDDRMDEEDESPQSFLEPGLQKGQRRTSARRTGRGRTQDADDDDSTPKCVFCKESFATIESLKTHLDNACWKQVKGLYNLETKYCKTCASFFADLSLTRFLEHIGMCMFQAKPKILRKKASKGASTVPAVSTNSEVDGSSSQAPIPSASTSLQTNASASSTNGSATSNSGLKSEDKSRNVNVCPLIDCSIPLDRMTDNDISKCMDALQRGKLRGLAFPTRLKLKKGFVYAKQLSDGNNSANKAQSSTRSAVESVLIPTPAPAQNISVVSTQSGVPLDQNPPSQDQGTTAVPTSLPVEAPARKRKRGKGRSKKSRRKPSSTPKKKKMEHETFTENQQQEDNGASPNQSDLVQSKSAASGGAAALDKNSDDAAATTIPTDNPNTTTGNVANADSNSNGTVGANSIIASTTPSTAATSTIPATSTATAAATTKPTPASLPVGSTLPSRNDISITNPSLATTAEKLRRQLRMKLHPSLTRIRSSTAAVTNDSTSSTESLPTATNKPNTDEGTGKTVTSSAILATKEKEKAVEVIDIDDNDSPITQTDSMSSGRQPAKPTVTSSEESNNITMAIDKQLKKYSTEGLLPGPSAAPTPSTSQSTLSSPVSLPTAVNVSAPPPPSQITREANTVTAQIRGVTTSPGSSQATIISPQMSRQPPVPSHGSNPISSSSNLPSSRQAQVIRVNSTFVPNGTQQQQQRQPATDVDREHAVSQRQAHGEQLNAQNSIVPEIDPLMTVHHRGNNQLMRESGNLMATGLEIRRVATIAQGAPAPAVLSGNVQQSGYQINSQCANTNARALFSQQQQHVSQQQQQQHVSQQQQQQHVSQQQQHVSQQQQHVSQQQQHISQQQQQQRVPQQLQQQNVPQQQQQRHVPQQQQHVSQHQVFQQQQQQQLVPVSMSRPSIYPQQQITPAAQPAYSNQQYGVAPSQSQSYTVQRNQISSSQVAPAVSGINTMTMEHPAPIQHVPNPGYQNMQQRSVVASISGPGAQQLAINNVPTSVYPSQVQSNHNANAASQNTVVVYQESSVYYQNSTGYNPPTVPVMQPSHPQQLQIQPAQYASEAMSTAANTPTSQNQSQPSIATVRFAPILNPLINSRAATQTGLQLPGILAQHQQQQQGQSNSSMMVIQSQSNQFHNTVNNNSAMQMQQLQGSNQSQQITSSGNTSAGSGGGPELDNSLNSFLSIAPSSQQNQKLRCPTCQILFGSESRMKEHVMEGLCD